MILDIAGVWRDGLIEALRNCRRRRREHATDRPKHAFDEVTKMRIHVDEEAAAANLAVVPTRPLARFVDAVEHPTSRTRAESRRCARRSPPVRARAVCAGRAGAVCPRPRHAPTPPPPPPPPPPHRPAPPRR